MNESRQTMSSCCSAPEEKPSLPCCCEMASPPEAGQARWAEAPWIAGAVTTPVGRVPRVSTTLRFADRLDAWKARWGIGRMRYRIEPGLYAVGDATADSLVFVSANYKLSFDHLRSQLDGRNGWILVLNTEGINVWCAAGKGTFGTEEIVRRAEAARLGEVVSHRTLVVPQRGASGVSAHEVKRLSGFQVVYGPMRGEDLSSFLDAELKAAPAMRRIDFPLRDRAVLIPLELVMSAKYALPAALGFLLLAGLGGNGYSFSLLATTGIQSAGLFLGVYLAGVILPPILLPWLPGRAFSAKGAWIGFALSAVLGFLFWRRPPVFENWATAAAWFLMIPAITSFLAMNFTGSSTYTSLSGVRREMRIAVPIQVACAAVGLVLWVAGRFV